MKIFSLFRNAKRFSSRGFTLLELMIVIIIVAVLVSTSLPKMQTMLVRVQLVESVSLTPLFRREVQRLALMGPGLDTDVDAPINNLVYPNLTLEEFSDQFGADLHVIGSNFDYKVTRGTSFTYHFICQHKTVQSDQYIYALNLDMYGDINSVEVNPLNDWAQSLGLKFFAQMFALDESLAVWHDKSRYSL